MYLISIYFDEKTNKKIQQYINQVAKETGNRYMLDGNVPPHITISAFETRNEEQAIAAFKKVVSELQGGNITWVCVGQFLPYVIFLAPVLNEYLHSLSQKVYNGFAFIDDVVISANYQPFQWVPHTTIGKKLSQEEMKISFGVLQNSFGMFEGKAVRIGLAKPNPHRDIVNFEL